MYWFVCLLNFSPFVSSICYTFMVKQMIRCNCACYRSIHDSFSLCVLDYRFVYVRSIFTSRAVSTVICDVIHIEYFIHVISNVMLCLLIACEISTMLTFTIVFLPHISTGFNVKLHHYSTAGLPRWTWSTRYPSSIRNTQVPQGSPVQCQTWRNTRTWALRA